MNILHMKYAVEVAKCGSINKAAEKLIIGQPNLSRAIKELETSLGIRIFERSAKGMTLTPEGGMFMTYAKKILKQVDELEETFRKGLSVKKHFSVAVPRSGYISQAFARFSALMNDKPGVELLCREMSITDAVDSVLRDDCRLGIVRYAEEYDSYYKAMFDEKKINYELVAEFRYMLVMNRDCPLAAKKDITLGDAENCIELVHDDSYVPPMSRADVRRAEEEGAKRRIMVTERGNRLDILAENPEAYMWASPIPRKTLDRYGLVQRDCADGGRLFKDVLIHKQYYTLSATDKLFIEQLIQTKRETMKKEW